MNEEQEEHPEPNCGAAPLRQALELINSLISSTYSTKFFPAKWQLIRDKLDQLSCGLAATGPDDDSAIAELLQGMTPAAEEIQLLIRRCSDEYYHGGKLQLRSDLDSAAAKLDPLIKKLSEIQASNLLTHSRAIILSRPAAGAAREEMRFYVKDLFLRLRIGGVEVRARALSALNEILGDDERYARLAVVETGDGVGLLVSLLEFDEMGIQEEASEALSLIAGFDCYRGALVTSGAIAPLVRVLEAGSEKGKERAARALVRLTENSDNAWSVSAQGGVTVLLKICGEGAGDDKGGELVSLACGVLRNLSGVGEIKRFMVEQGVVSVLVKLSRAKEEMPRIQSIEFLSSLAIDDESIKQKVVREGMVEALVLVLDPNYPSSSKAREVALRAVEGLCYSSPNSMNLLMSSGFLNQVLFMIMNGETSVQESALKAAFLLCKISEEAKRAMGDMGFMPELVRLLEARSPEVREMAAGALCRMVSIQRNRRRFIQEEHNVNRILQLLDPEEKSVTKKSLLSLLMSLTQSNSGRRKLAASGYVKNLEKLSETDATDAKKIIKKLSSNRFRSILSGIWG